jgi:putative hydrolase of HD superfamily
MNEEKLYAFLTEMEKLKSTTRHNWTRTGRHESSAEHSWRIAVFFMLAHDMFDLQVDFKKLMKMILIHDAPEIEFGDIPAFIKDSDPVKHKAHKDREIIAAKELFDLLPENVAKEYLGLFEEFEQGKTPEAKVGKALDRIESQLQHLESGPKYWAEEEKGEHMLHYPDNAVNTLNNSHINKIWDIIYQELKKLQ